MNGGQQGWHTPFEDLTDPVVVIRVDEPGPGRVSCSEAYVRLRRWPEPDDTVAVGDTADSEPGDGMPPLPRRLSIGL